MTAQMKRIIKKTADGSHTLHVSDLDETYHSLHGAIKESQHVFVKEGLLYLNKPHTEILEIGFGTGLNAALTLIEAEKREISIVYHCIELYPLKPEEYNRLNYFDNESLYEPVFKRLHESQWNRTELISKNFAFSKYRVDLLSHSFTEQYDLVYFDAFSPRAQPEMWTSEVFDKMHKAMKKNGVLVTYCASGKVRRNMEGTGLKVEKIAGPPGKREMIRATKTDGSW